MTRSRQATARGVPASAGTRQLRVVLVLKTNQGAMWTIPHVDALTARGHRVVAVLPPGDGRLRTEFTRRGVPVVDSPFDFRFRPSIRTLTGLVELRRRLRELAPDVVHYHLYASALAARLASTGLSAARVHMVAGPLHMESGVIRAVERLLVRLDTVTISGSEFTGRRYRELGRAAEQTPVIPYGVDTRQFRPMSGTDRTTVRAAIDAGAYDFVVIMVALVYAPKRVLHAGRGIKGHDVLLKAWQRFRATHPNSHLLLVGGGFDEAGERHRRELIARFRVDGDDSVTWLGTVEDVRPYYAAADLSVSPSLSDNHGAALEAGAMGLPSVVSDVGALPEAVDTRSCWIVPPDDPDALAAALDDAYTEHAAGRLRDRGDHVREHVLRRFDSARAAVAVADVIEDAAGVAVRRSATGGEAGGRRVSLFLDARFGRGRDGRWAASEFVSGREAWARYTAGGDRLRIVARAGGEPGGAGCPVEGNGTTVRPLPDYRGAAGFVRALPRLVPAVTREVADAEVVVLRMPGAIGSVAALVCMALRRSYAVEVVGDPYDVLASGTLGRAGRAAARSARAQMRWVVRGASAVRYVTQTTLQQRYPAAAGARTIGLAGVVIRSESLVESPRVWSPSSFDVIAVGSHEQHYKGHDVLLRALHRLTGEGLDVRAVVVGGGRQHGELVDLASSLGLAERVRFTGTVHDRRSVIELLDAANLFVMPSRTEGLPRALVEAMARALPAVGTRVGGIPELLDPRCLVDADDHEALARVMRWLLTDAQAWECQSRRNLDLARTFESSLLDEQFSAWLAQVRGARQGRAT
ncbi:glycosyltransferase [Saccharothrix sp.]|uniref:glycosyltransferase n=1 Tax=Saccharothrix sp. TaxID=1873460 RepID=UPI002810A08C|nr:glycosyltransferase [Saccharothrix sp.]